MSRRAFLAAVGLFSVLLAVLYLATGVGDVLAESSPFNEQETGTRPGQEQENSPPRFSDFTNNLSVAENLPNESPVGAPLQATDADGDTLTYSLGGTDAASFAIAPSTGQLKTNATLDYETRNSYTVTVMAADPYKASGAITVTIAVTDVDEDGEITFSSAQPQAYTGLVATLVDDDIVQSIQSWQWEISSDKSSWNSINGATTGTYVPLAGDVGKYLRVAVTYTDGHGPGKTAAATTTSRVDDEDEDEDESPAFSTGAAQRSIAENTPANTNIGQPVTATHGDTGSLTYTLGGMDTASFAIVPSTGQLQTKAALDYEVKNSYTVTVKATNSSLDSGTVTVTITVIDVEELGTVSFDSTTPTMGIALNASLSDPDGSVTGKTWQWASATTTTGSFGNISGATSASYTPAAWDVGKYLRATATYTDGHGSGKTAYSTPTNAVRMSNRPPAFPDSGGGMLSPACTPSIGFRTGIPFSFTAAKGGEGPPGLWMEVWDRELCGMNFRVSSGAKWLSVSPASGRSEGAHDQRLIRLSADTSGLGVGTYTAAVRITAPGSSNSPQTLSVSLAITEPAPPESSHCHERTVIESSDGTIRVVIPANSAPCDIGITVESLDMDSRKTPVGQSVDVVRAGKVSAEAPDSRINAGLWALLPGDRVSGCEGAAAAVYRVDSESWEPLTHRCEEDTEGRVWTVSPLTGFGIYAVTLLAPAVESVIADEVQEPGADAAGTDFTLDSRVPCRILVAPDLPPPEAETCRWVTVPGHAPPEERTSCLQMIIPGQSSPEAETCRWMTVPGQVAPEERPACQQLIIPGQSSLEMAVEEDPECSLTLTSPAAGVAFADDSVPGPELAPPPGEIEPAVEETESKGAPAALAPSQTEGIDILTYAAAAAIAVLALLLLAFFGLYLRRRHCHVHLI